MAVLVLWGSRTRRVVLAQVLVEDGLEGETFGADRAAEGLVASVLADVVLQLVFPGVLLPTQAANKGRDAHVEPHVAIQAALLVEGLAAVDAGKSRVVAEPAVAHLLPQVVLIATRLQGRCLLPLQKETPHYYKSARDCLVPPNPD